MQAMHSKPLRAISAAVVLFALVGCGSSQARYQSHMDRGQQYLASGNLEKADVEFRNALQIEPKNAAALYLDGRVAELRGNARYAVGLYQAALDIKPDHQLARASLAKLLVFGGAPQRALEILQPGLLTQPDNADLLSARAAARHQIGDDVDAHADAERAVQLSPTNEDAVAVLAALDAQAGNTEQALFVVQQAATRTPSSAGLRQILIGLYLQAARPQQAEREMRSLIELRPRELQPRLQLALFLNRAQRLDEAQAVLEAAVRDLPRNDQAKLALVDLIVRQRSRPQGEHTLREFIARDPNNAQLRLSLGALLERTGATEEAVVTYRDVIAREGTDSMGLAARDRIAAVEVTRGHSAEAQRLVSEVLRESPHDNNALIMRASMELERNDAAAAIVDLRTVLRDQPQSVLLQRMLARGYLARGDTALAEDTLQAAVNSAPGDLGVRLDLARLLLQTQRAAQAVALLQQAVQDAPGDVQTRESLIRAELSAGDLAAARAAAEELKKQWPGRASGFLFAGFIAQQENRTDDAQKNLEHALQLEPDSSEVVAALARFEHAHGKGAQAIAQVQALVARSPQNTRALDLLGELYLADQDLPRALETLRRAVQLDPRSWESHLALAHTRLAMNDTAAAVSEYVSAVTAAPDHGELALELANLYEKLGRVDDAIASYERLYAANSRLRQIAANNLAMLLVTYRTDSSSLDRARDLTQGFDTSGNGAMLDTQGWVRFRRREFQNAVAELERAAQQVPDSRVIRYHLGMAELEVGQREQARRNFEVALAGNAVFPGSDAARMALAGLTQPSG
jgi:tetratricopeptide (TPR) repeat protein